MIDLEFLERLIRAIDESGLDSVEIERGGTRVRVSKTPPAGGGEGPASARVQPSVPAAGSPPASGAAQAGADSPGAPAAGAAEGSGGSDGEAGAATAEEADEELVEVTSPMVGTFYRAPAPDAPPYIETGDRVARGDTLCIIEAMKLMNELDTEVAGTITEICVENAEPVEYGQALFRIKPD